MRIPQGVVLTGIASQLNPAGTRILSGERLDHPPGIIASAVFDKDNLGRRFDGIECGNDAAMQFRLHLLRPVQGNHD